MGADLQIWMNQHTESFQPCTVCLKYLLKRSLFFAIFFYFQVHDFFYDSLTENIYFTFLMTLLHGSKRFISAYRKIRPYNNTNMWCVKINTPPWVFFTFFRWYKWYQMAQRITYLIVTPHTILTSVVQQL